MEFAEIIEQFGASPLVPKEAILAAVTEPAAFVPKAIDILERRAAGAALSEAEADAIDLIVHALGEIGDTRACGPLMDLLAISRSELEAILGDCITESLPGILMRIAGDNTALLEEAVVRPQTDEFVRWSIFSAWTYFALVGRIERDAARMFLTEFPGRAKKAGIGKNDNGWVGWVEAVADLQFRELMPLVEAFFSEGYLPRGALPAATDIEDFRRLLNDAEKAENRDAWMVRNGYVPFTDMIGELSDWYCYSEEYHQEILNWSEEAEFEEAQRALAIASNPYRSVGRNDPCPCGSGKKYKKCCLQ
jgi:hypothetical protein